ITISGVRGTSGAATIKTWGAQGDTGLESLAIDDVDCGGTSNVLINLGGDAPNSVINISRVVWRRDANNVIVLLESGANLGNVKIDGLDILDRCSNVFANHGTIQRLEVTGWNVFPTAGTTGTILRNYADGTIANLLLDGLRASYPAPVTTYVLGNAGTLGEATLRSVTLVGSGELFNAEAGSTAG